MGLGVAFTIDCVTFMHVHVSNCALHCTSHLHTVSGVQLWVLLTHSMPVGTNDGGLDALPQECRCCMLMPHDAIVDNVGE